ncbi:MAG TPA: hypothetical protein PKK36_11530 [Kiritimatiellia bacterium]|nr:hypothetical protein [Kiritimatiellia bacterium]
MSDLRDLALLEVQPVVEIIIAMAVSGTMIPVFDVMQPTIFIIPFPLIIGIIAIYVILHGEE